MVKALALQTRSSEQTGSPEPPLMTNRRGNLPAFPALKVRASWLTGVAI